MRRRTGTEDQNQRNDDTTPCLAKSCSWTDRDCDRIVTQESVSNNTNNGTMYFSNTKECSSSPSPCYHKRIEDDDEVDDSGSSIASPPKAHSEACMGGGTLDHLARPALPLIVNYFSEASSYQALEKQVADLQNELQLQQERLTQKDVLLQKLQSATDLDHTLRQVSGSLDSNTEQMSSGTDSYYDEDEHATNTWTSKTAPFRSFSVEETLKSFSTWLFREASLREEVTDFLPAYASFLKIQGIPVHRLCVMTAHAPMGNKDPDFQYWAWEEGELTQQRITASQANGDTMMEFLQGRSDERCIRVHPDSKFGDCFAMPIRHKHKCKGGLAWFTKEGFSEKHIAFLNESHAALSAVVRSYLNEHCIEHVVNHLDEEIEERTRVLERANEKLYEANQKIKQQAGQQLKHFAMMSHELRTPLNGMIGLTSLLQNSVEDMSPEQAEIVDMIANSGDLLLRVVNDVLDYSKLTLGMVEITKEVTTVVPLLEQVIDATRVKAQQRGIRIKTYYSTDLPSFIVTDGRRLQQIVFNLLGNAIKFSKDDDVVEMKVTKISAMAGSQYAKPRLRIMVKDYGKGIDKSNFAKIFEPFQQGDAETERTYGGTGLGLAITSRLVKSLGGSITVDSQIGQWSVFSIELDLDELPEEAAEESQEGLPTDEEVIHLSSSSLRFRHSSDLGVNSSIKPIMPPKSKKVLQLPVFDKHKMDSFRVLVAEDNRINQTLLKRTLDRLGVVHVDIVGDGSIAVKECNENTYDLILMDMQMPEMDGVEATRLIRRHCAKNANTKIIFVTAHALRDYEAKALEVGANGFLSKPYKFHSIKEIIETALQDTK